MACCASSAIGSGRRLAVMTADTIAHRLEMHFWNAYQKDLQLMACAKGCPIDGSRAHISQSGGPIFSTLSLHLSSLRASSSASIATARASPALETTVDLLDPNRGTPQRRSCWLFNAGIHTQQAAFLAASQHFIFHSTHPQSPSQHGFKRRHCQHTNVAHEGEV